MEIELKWADRDRANEGHRKKVRHVEISAGCYKTKRTEMEAGPGVEKSRAGGNQKGLGVRVKVVRVALSMDSAMGRSFEWEIRASTLLLSRPFDGMARSANADRSAWLACHCSGMRAAMGVWVMPADEREQ